MASAVILRHCLSVAGIPTTDETDWQAVGKRIRDARERRGLKQTELADAIDVRAHTMWRYEAGRLSFKAETLTRIAVALGVSERWLMTGREAESVELDEELGPPGMESYFQNMEAEGTPVPLAMKRELRDRAQSEGPDSITEARAMIMHRDLLAEHQGKALRRRPVAAEVETDRGQRPLKR